MSNLVNNFLSMKPTKVGAIEVKVDDFGAKMSFYGKDIAFLTNGKLSITNNGIKNPKVLESLNQLPNVKIDVRGENWFLNNKLWKGQIVNI